MKLRGTGQNCEGAPAYKCGEMPEYRSNAVVGWGGGDGPMGT